MSPAPHAPILRALAGYAALAACVGAADVAPTSRQSAAEQTSAPRAHPRAAAPPSAVDWRHRIDSFGTADVAPPALAAVTGDWHLSVAGERLALRLWWADGALRGALLRGDLAGEGEPLEEVIRAADGALRFRRRVGASADWYRVRVEEGVMTGRAAPAEDPETAPAWERFTRHVTGWNATWIDETTTARAWDLLVDGRERATLRVDARPEGGFVGTLKVYASVARGIADEQVERDIEVVRWDGVALEFVEVTEQGRRYYAAEVSGREIRGTALATPDGTLAAIAGTRVDVLGFGLVSRTDGERARWQARARRQLARLLMDGAPRPVVSELRVVGERDAPGAAEPANPTRDDSPAGARAYKLRELALSYAIPNPYGGPALTRQVRAFMAVPEEAPPPGGFPVAIALNGHWGSAWQTFVRNSSYWYGDAFARRGYMVIAVDVSHRPVADRGGRYGDLPNGDDPASGNGTHPAIRAEGMDSDWEEDGERAWDVMRAVDLALARSDVDPSRVTVVGLSMGGEVATIAGALDPRITAVVSAGFAPDVAVYRYRHHPCWSWAWADVNEYVDVSDYHALVAPRTLVVETGRTDATYSVAALPFASDKQVLRRSRRAFADAPGRVLHFLHGNAHSFQVGEVGLGGALATGVTVPTIVAPESPWSVAWQLDPRTEPLAPSLFDLFGSDAR